MFALRLGVFGCFPLRCSVGVLSPSDAELRASLDASRRRSSAHPAVSMAVGKFFALRKPLLALTIGFLAFSVLAAAEIASSRSHDDIPVGSLTVAQIEEQLQVRMLHVFTLNGSISKSTNCLQQCPLVQSLNEHKVASAPQTTSLTARIFAVLFPGSPAVNSLLATLYISGPPSTFNASRSELSCAY